MKRVFIRLDYLLEDALVVSHNMSSRECEVTLKNGKQLTLLNDVAKKFLEMVYANKNFNVVDSENIIQIINENY